VEEVVLNSPMDRITTISDPARIPERQFGSATVASRRQKPAPRLAAPSSSVFRSVADSTARTARTMNGSVNNTWPTRMNAHDVRNSRQVP